MHTLSVCLIYPFPPSPPLLPFPLTPPRGSDLWGMQVLSCFSTLKGEGFSAEDAEWSPAAAGHWACIGVLPEEELQELTLHCKETRNERFEGRVLFRWLLSVLLPLCGHLHASHCSDYRCKSGTE